MTQPAPANWRHVPHSTRNTSISQKRVSAVSTRSKPQRHGKSFPSAFERGIAKARVYVDTSTPDDLETQLQTFLTQKSFVDAAFLIAASPYLTTRFQTADVARLMLEQVKSPDGLEQVAQFVRDLKLQENKELVTLLISDMVHARQFDAAVRVAQEMVPDFLTACVTTTKQPCWTPLALIQAMLRAGKYRAALKYSKQFGLLATFPAPQLIAGMLETRCWEEAISSIMEMQLFREFPLEALAVEMMRQRQWSQAAKCMNKMSDKDDTRAKFYETLVRELAHVGDFVTSLRYLREFKLDQGNEDTTQSLLRYLVDSMLAHGEFYKALKYAIKFKLAKNPRNDAATESALAVGNGEEALVLNEDSHLDYMPQYNFELLIRKAIDSGQFHVATTYIKRLRLRENFAEELVAIEKAQQNRLLEFRQYAQLRLAQFEDATFQQSLRALLGDQADDEMVELEVVEKDIVLSETEEILSHDKKTQQIEDKEEENKCIKKRCQASESNETGETRQCDFDAPAKTSDESRFGFARATPPSLPLLSSGPVSLEGLAGVDSDSQPCINSSSSVKSSVPPPGLSDSPSESDAVQDYEQDDASGFNFANFAKSVQVNAPPPPHSTSSSLLLQQVPPPSQQQQVQAIGGQPIPNGQYASGPPGYSMQLTMPQENRANYPQGKMLRGAMQPRGYLQPPPLPPSPPPLNNGGAFDVAALAMQFHNGDSSNGSSGFTGCVVGPRPPMVYSGAVPNDQQQQVLPGMSFAPYSAPSPQPAFKPSMSYTSVTTIRQKK